MRVLVTGGAGFIGSHVVDALAARGHTVTALDDLSNGKREHVPTGVPLEVADVRDARALADVFAKARPEVVVHQAAQVSVKRSVDDPLGDADVNVIGGIQVIRAAVAAGVGRLVFASTGGAIYGELRDANPADETREPRPESPYAAAKASFELYLRVFQRTAGLRHTILRYSNVYGPRQDPHGEAGVVAIFLTRLRAGAPLTLFGRRAAGDDGCVRDYIYVADVAAANVLAVEAGLDGIYNVASGETHTTRQVADALARALEARATVQAAPPRPGDVEVSRLDAARLRACGWHPKVTFNEGVQKLVDQR
jgi:UDP-glucose 4-epimerase